MKKSAKTDSICARKAIHYLDDIKNAFEHFKINDYKDLEKTNLAHYAVTQLITNLNSLKENMQSSTITSMTSFNKINLKEARNRASHAYNRIKFESIYNICLELTKDEVYKELREILKGEKK